MTIERKVSSMEASFAMEKLKFDNKCRKRLFINSSGGGYEKWIISENIRKSVSVLSYTYEIIIMLQNIMKKMPQGILHYWQRQNKELRIYWNSM